MPARPPVHPSADALKAFGLGKLDDRSAGVLMNHLDHCADCCKVVAAQSGDDFLDRLRKVHSQNSTVPPANALSESLVIPKSPVSPPANPTAIPNLPPELAANPQYEILRELGRGGMGVVYLAKNKLMDRLEVLKVVNKALLDRPGAVERFLREIRSAAKLSHANVVKAYNALQMGDVLVFAMEYVEGDDLAAVVKAQGVLPVAHACYYIQQAALGLQHAFEKHMVHRDIKPQNLILAREGKKHIVKVLDFGLAKVLREKTEDSGLTGEGQMLGTPDYIAPEQTLDAAKADIRADIYSLGCTLYYLLAGRAPFRAASLGAILLAHQMQEAKPLNLVRPEVPEELAAVVSKMMAKERAKRYQTPLEVAQALGPFIKPRAKEPPPKSSPDLSAGVAEVQSDPSIASAVEEIKRKATVPSVPAAEGGDVRTTDGITPALSRKSSGVHERWSAVRSVVRKKWLIGGGVAAGVILLALLGMWAGGVFKPKTEDGTIVRKNLSSDANLMADGGTVRVPPSVELKANAEDKKAPGGIEEKWFREVSALPAAKQVEAVAAKLKERNPDFDGNVAQRIESDVVTELRFSADGTADISPVRALAGLKILRIQGRSEEHRAILSDLTPLKGMKLTTLYCDVTQVSDLSPLKDMKLTRFGCAATPVSDLSPLKDMKLTVLYCNSTRVSDLTPLKDMKLTVLHCPDTPVSDLSPLKDMQLTFLNCSMTQVSDLSPLKDMNLTVLYCNNTHVSNLSPLKDMQLTHLNCRHTQVSDLTPLKNMRLTELRCNATLVSDLSPLKDMKLKILYCDHTPVSDLSPLKTIPLKELWCDFKPERDTEILRSIKTLEKINGKPTIAFWKAFAPPEANGRGFVPLFNRSDPKAR